MDWRQRAIARLEQLVTTYPDHADYHHRLAGTLNDFFDDSETFADSDAISTYETALQHELIALRLNPEHRQYQRFASIQYTNLAERWENQKEHAKAVDALKEAIKHRQFCIDHGDSQYGDRHHLAHYWLALGSNLAYENRDDEAESAYRFSSEQSRELAEKFQRNPHYLSMLADVLNIWSFVMEKRDDLDGARQCLQQAVSHEEEAMRTERNNVDHRKSLAEYQVRLATLSQSLDKPGVNPMTSSIADTDALITQAGGGDRSAERELFERHGAKLRRMVAIRMDPRLAARFDPSDVVQEALLTASVQLPEYALMRPLPFYPWLRNVAWQRLVDLHNHHFTAQRRSVVREVVMQLPDESALKLAMPLMASNTSPSEIMIRKELCARVQTTLEELPPNDREVLVMRHLEKMSVSEIAAILEISESAVKMRRLRAVQKFKELLSGE